MPTEKLKIRSLVREHDNVRSVGWNNMMIHVYYIWVIIRFTYLWTIVWNLSIWWYNDMIYIYIIHVYIYIYIYVTYHVEGKQPWFEVEKPPTDPREKNIPHDRQLPVLWRNFLHICILVVPEIFAPFGVWICLESSPRRKKFYTELRKVGKPWWLVTGRHWGSF